MGDCELIKEDENITDKAIYLLEKIISICFASFEVKFIKANNKIIVDCSYYRNLDTNVFF